MSRLPKLSLLVSLLFLSSLQFIQRTIFRRCYSNYIGIFRRKPRYGILFDLIASTSRAVHYRASRQRERNHTRYTTHRAGRCRKKFKTFGTATERESTEAVFLILPLSDKRTEVKLSLYRNELTVTRKNEVNQKQTSHTMLLKESTYDKWLNKLKAEVKRRKKLV